MLNGGGAKVVRKGRIPKIIKYHLEEQVRRWRVEERKDEDEIAALCVQVAPESGVTRQNVHSYLQRLSEPEKDEMGIAVETQRADFQAEAHKYKTALLAATDELHRIIQDNAPLDRDRREAMRLRLEHLRETLKLLGQYPKEGVSVAVGVQVSQGAELRAWAKRVLSE